MTEPIAEIASVMVLRSCACGSLRCAYCKKQVSANRCAGIPFGIQQCPHCGYPLNSKKIG